MSKNLIQTTIKTIQPPRIIGCSQTGFTPTLVKNAAKYNVIGFEIRADYFIIQPGKEFENTISKNISTILGSIIILTIRSKREGGEFSGPRKLKEYIFLEFLPWIDILDLEINEIHKFQHIVSEAKKANKCILGSHHDFNSVPSIKRAKDIISKGKDYGADFIKIAGTANTLENLKTLLRIQLDLVEYSPLTVMGMGKFALLSRVLLANLGSIWTYGAIGKPTAPNQPTCKEIFELSKIFPANE